MGLLIALVFILFQALGGDGEPELVAVPNVTNVPEEEAVQRLEDAGLVPSIEREASDEIELGRAIRTDPPFGTEVATDTRITLFISSGRAELSVPILIGRNAEKIEALARAHGIARWGTNLVRIRAGVRSRTLPFQAAGNQVTERSGTLGTGLSFAQGRVAADLAAIYSSRNASLEMRERAWTFSIGLTARP